MQIVGEIFDDSFQPPYARSQQESDLQMAFMNCMWQTFEGLGEGREEAFKEVLEELSKLLPPGFDLSGFPIPDFNQILPSPQR